jgi:hypothetical protein
MTAANPGEFLKNRNHPAVMYREYHRNPGGAFAAELSNVHPGPQAHPRRTLAGRRDLLKLVPVWISLLAMVPLSHILTGLVAWQPLRDAGLDTWVAVIVWAGATKLLYERSRGIEPGAENRGGRRWPCCLQRRDPGKSRQLAAGVVVAIRNT